MFDAEVTAEATTTVNFTKGDEQLVTVQVLGPDDVPVEGARVCFTPDGPDLGPTATGPCDSPGAPFGHVTNGAGNVIFSLKPYRYHAFAGHSPEGFNTTIEGEGSPAWIGGPGSPGLITVLLGRSFTDVVPGLPFYADINWMSQRGIAGGFEDGSFRPTTAVSRQAMASFLLKLAGQPATLLSQPFFADVGEGHPFYGAIQWMGSHGVSVGTPNPHGGKPLYKPNDPVSRQAMAAFLWRYAEEPAAQLDDPFFFDVGAGSTFYAPIEWMGESGVSRGTPYPPFKPLYYPTNPVSRQAMAAFLHRYGALV